MADSLVSLTMARFVIHIKTIDQMFCPRKDQGHKDSSTLSFLA